MPKPPTTPASKTSDGAAWRPTLDEYEPSLTAAADACGGFVAALAAQPESGHWLTLAGVNGCGKSMLAEQLLAQARRLNPDRGLIIGPRERRACTWIDERDLARRMRGGEWDLPEYLGGDFFVVLDELGATRDPSTFVADAIARLCQARRDKWTVFTTNLTMQEIAERQDARIASRLIRDRNRFVTITAGDYALRLP